MSRKSLINIMTAPPVEPNDNFLRHITSGIEHLDRVNHKDSSKFYKPSSMNCQRNMYYMRIGAKEDPQTPSYSAIDIARTGTDRHEDIQNALIQLNDLKSSEWLYIDVGDYVEEQKKRGMCEDLELNYRKGNEAHFINHRLNLSFMCDGILYHKPEDEYYLFEFKNQASKKASYKTSIDPDHLNQVICYCLCFNLDKVIMLYEDRDICTLYCPPVVVVNQTMKDAVERVLLSTENMVENHLLPKMVSNPALCKWCKYKKQCESDGE